MSMKKILMTAVAVTALSAGAASAASISSAKINSFTVWDGTTAAPYTIGNETIFPTAGLGTQATGNAVTAKVVSGRLGNGSYTVTYDITGPAGFTAALGNSAVGSDANSEAGTNACIVAPVLQSGGTLGSKSVTYLLTVSGTCDTTLAAALNDNAPQLFTLTSPLTVTGLGDVTVKATFAQGGTSIDNGTSSAKTLITNAAAFTAKASADTTPTQFALGTTTVYTSLQASASVDDVIGKVTVTGNSGVFLNASSTTTATEDATNVALLADLALTGDFTNLSAKYAGGATTTGLTAGGSAFTRASPFTSVTAAGVTVGTDSKIFVAISGTPTASLTSKAMSLSVTPKMATPPTTHTIPAAFTQALQTIGLQGTNYTAPWVGGSQSSAATGIRLSNTGAATGAVTLQLLAPVYNAGTTPGATTCTSSTLSKLSSISANSELSILNEDLTTCFGDFKRGDVVVTVQAESTSLTAKARNVNAATGVVSEISLK